MTATIYRRQIRNAPEGARTFGSNSIILAARILLMVIFVLYGWSKLIGFSGTVHAFARMGLPLPWVAACVAVLMEFFGGIAIMLGVLTRPLAILLAVYTIATGLLGHHFWTMTGAARAGNEINFLKNIGIAGGFLLLYVTGAGKYSVDTRLELG